MKIVRDEPKRRINLEKHGLDFAEFEAAFSWEKFITVPGRPSLTTDALARSWSDVWTIGWWSR